MSNAAVELISRIRGPLSSKKAKPDVKLPALAELHEAISGDSFNQYEPVIVEELLSTLLNRFDDKPAVTKEIEKCITDLISNCNKWAITCIVDRLLEAMDDASKWQVKRGACKALTLLAQEYPETVAHCIPAIIRVVPHLILDLKTEVSDAAHEAVEECCSIIDNGDIQPAIPALVKAMNDVNQVAECVHTLASIKFVQTVDDAALGLVVPLLLRGFADKKTATKRQCSVIIINLSKLVENPRDAEPFLPTLLPACERAASEIADPEARQVANKAFEQLQRIERSALAYKEAHPDDAEDVIEMFKTASSEEAVQSALAFVKYAATAASALNHSKNYDVEEWQTHVQKVLAAGLPEPVAQTMTDYAHETLEKPVNLSNDDDDDGEVLCQCKFTLAYGTKILLHNTDLKLFKGRRYGLLGPNDCGKTSLMKSMANHELEGFPSHLKTVFVEADILGELSHLSCLEYVFADEAIQASNVSREEISEMLQSVGFTEKMCNDPITTLSGGWRMKLALARAMLQRAEVLLMDEPTNHLDVLNVAWVKEYVNSLTDVSVISVSHDSGFLQDCMTDIIQFDGLKLFQFHGKLDKFVEQRPEAKAFFSLKESKISFKFPDPTFLDGVKSRGKPLIKMARCSMTYPGNTVPTVSDVTVQVSLSSRVACIGRNGAGKSTVIKMLTGELEPTEGSVWMYSGMKMAYVAQHAFHHLEKHLTKTANEYIRWRYEFGEDKEGLEKSTVKLSEEEIAFMQKPITWEYTDEKGNMKREPRVIRELTGARRQNPESKKQDFQYQLIWAKNDVREWVSGELLEKWGWTKQLKTINAKVEAREGMYRRTLTSDNVEKHLLDVGLEAEYATHTRIGALSGGQKVKVVLAAATWNQPHLMILDEPTNYLDRESLGGLIKAIDAYQGGVVIISHNDEFCSTVCPETWLVEDGQLNAKGDAEWMKNAMKEKTEFKLLEEVTDALGNKIKVKAPKKELSRKEKKKREKARKAALARGEVLSDDEDF